MYISPQFYDITRCLWHVNHVSQEHELECKKRCFLCSFVFKIRWKVCHRVRTHQMIGKHTEIVNHYIFVYFSLWKILSIEFHIYRNSFISHNLLSKSSNLVSYNVRMFDFRKRQKTCEKRMLYKDFHAGSRIEYLLYMTRYCHSKSYKKSKSKFP